MPRIGVNNRSVSPRRPKRNTQVTEFNEQVLPSEKPTLVFKEPLLRATKLRLEKHKVAQRDSGLEARTVAPMSQHGCSPGLVQGGDGYPDIVAGWPSHNGMFRD